MIPTVTTPGSLQDRENLSMSLISPKGAPSRGRPGYGPCGKGCRTETTQVNQGPGVGSGQSELSLGLAKGRRCLAWHRPGNSQAEQGDLMPSPRGSSWASFLGETPFLTVSAVQCQSHEHPACEHSPPQGAPLSPPEVSPPQRMGTLSTHQSCHLCPQMGDRVQWTLGQRGHLEHGGDMC